MTMNTLLQHDVMSELQYEPSIDASNIGVTAKDGIVNLTGTVSSYADKYAAASAAERVAGLKAVTDETTVDLPSFHQRNDQDIAQATVNALTWHIWVPRDAIKVKVERGWVTLEGTVTSKFQQTAAQNAVQHLMGVAGVSNLIHIKSPVKLSDVKTKIEGALRRAAELDEAKIKVEVIGNTVVLRGHVSSGAQRDRAERAAWSAPGVWEVEDYLEVDSSLWEPSC